MVTAPIVHRKIMQVGSQLFIPIPSIWQKLNNTKKGQEVEIGIYTDKFVVRIKKEKNE